MEITKISVRTVEAAGLRLKGFATVEFDGVFRVTNLRIIDSGKRMFVAMPSRENFRRCKECGTKISYRDRYCRSCKAEQVVELPKVEYKDVAYSMDKAFSTQLEDAVLEEYRKVLKNKIILIKKK